MLVIGVGATYTLASWTDSEWVWGGSDTTPTVGTDTFEVQQNTSKPFVNTGWIDQPNNPGGSLEFAPAPIKLAPGQSVYAPVTLKTTAGSLEALTALQGAVGAVGAVHDTDLAGAIILNVYTQTRPEATPSPTTACAASFDTTGWTRIVSDGFLSTPGAPAQTLEADETSVQHYCFVMTLPNTVAVQTNSALQGKTIAPAWQFISNSVVEP